MTAEPDRDRADLVEATTVDDLSRARILARVRREIDAVRELDGLARTATEPSPRGAVHVRQRYAHGGAGPRAQRINRGSATSETSECTAR